MPLLVEFEICCDLRVHLGRTFADALTDFNDRCYGRSIVEWRYSESFLPGDLDDFVISGIPPFHPRGDSTHDSEASVHSLQTINVYNYSDNDTTSDASILLPCPVFLAAGHVASKRGSPLLPQAAPFQ